MEVVITIYYNTLTTFPTNTHLLYHSKSITRGSLTFSAGGSLPSRHTATGEGVQTVHTCSPVFAGVGQAVVGVCRVIRMIKMITMSLIRIMMEILMIINVFPGNMPLGNVCNFQI